MTDSAHPGLRVYRYPVKVDLARMKGINQIRLLDVLRAEGPVSRARLSRLSSLTPPAVSALVKDLHKRNLIREVGRGKSTGGRRPVMLEFNPAFGHVVGVDLGASTTRFAAADFVGRIIHRFEEKTLAAGPAQAVLDQIQFGIERLLRNCELQAGDVHALGIGVPGMTNVTEGRVINAVNLEGWIDVPLRDILEGSFGMPVAVDNDVNMAALGEHWKGRAQGQKNFVFMAMGTGIGAGIFLDGKLHRGHRWYAGEISHINLDYRRWATDYGEHGYLESRVGASAIERLAERAFGPPRSRKDAQEKPDPSRLFRAARFGNSKAAQAVQKIGVFLGTAVANIATILDPSMVVFGGGISQYGEQLLDPIRKVASKIIANCPEICLSSLGTSAQLYGAIHLALQTAESRMYESVMECRPGDSGERVTQSLDAPETAGSA